MIFSRSGQAMHTLKYYLLSNAFYRRVLRPFDRILYPVVPGEEIAAERRGGRIGLNKVAQVADIQHPDWASSSAELGEHYWCIAAPDFHRKLWEYNQILFSLRRSGFLTPESTGLSLGAGHEPLLYYLTHKIKRIVGIDLYESQFIGGEDDRDTVEAVEKYAPFPFDRDRIELRRMDARRLEFPDACFDLAFSVSSIEHFGRPAEIAASLGEVRRVLKPGGLLVLTTELRLNRLGTNIPGAIVFRLQPLLDLFQQAGFEPHGGAPDLRIEREHLERTIKLPEEALRRPHVILRFGNTIFTSLCLAWRKPGDGARRGPEKPAAITRFRYDAGIRARLEKSRAAAGEEMAVRFELENRCDFTWFAGGMSHRIAVAVKLLAPDGREIDPGYCDFTLPGDVRRGERLSFAARIKAPPAPGRYRFLFDMKKELITWFSEKGSQPCLVDIAVE
jgi:SAM-dependent methyltransferase